MKKVISVLFVLVLLAGCSSDFTVHECNSGENNLFWTDVKVTLESKDGIITKIEQSTVLNMSDAIMTTPEDLAEEYEAFKQEQEAVGIEFTYAFNNDKTVFTTETVIDINQLDKNYLENDSIFAFFDSYEVEDHIKAFENGGFTCELK